MGSSSGKPAPQAAEKAGGGGGGGGGGGAGAGGALSPGGKHRRNSTDHHLGVSSVVGGFGGVDRDMCRNFKVLCVGAPRVGKTCVVHRYLKNQFVGSAVNPPPPTSKVEVGIKFIEANYFYTIQVWECPAVDWQFEKLRNLWLRDVTGVMVVVSTKDIKSFELIDTWKKAVDEYSAEHKLPPIPIVVLANKVCRYMSVYVGICRYMSVYGSIGRSADRQIGCCQPLRFKSSTAADCLFAVRFVCSRSIDQIVSAQEKERERERLYGPSTHSSHAAGGGGHSHRGMHRSRRSLFDIDVSELDSTADDVNAATMIETATQFQVAAGSVPSLPLPLPLLPSYNSHYSLALH